MHLNCLNDSFDKHSPFTQETKSSQRRKAAGTGRTLAACGQGAGELPLHPAANANLPAQLSRDRGNPGAFPPGSHKHGSRGCACNHVCPQAAAFVGTPANGYSLPAGAGTPATLPIRTPGISVRSSVPNDVRLSLQIQLLLRSVVPWFSLVCLRPKWLGAPGAALCPRPVLLAGKAREGDESFAGVCLPPQLEAG